MVCHSFLLQSCVGYTFLCLWWCLVWKWTTLHVIAMSWILLWIEIMWPWKLHQSAMLKRGIFLLTWLIRGMFTSREASTTSWSEMPGLTKFYISARRWLICNQKVKHIVFSCFVVDNLFQAMVVKGVNEISMVVVVGSVCLYCGLRPFDARIVEISSNVGWTISGYTFEGSSEGYVAFIVINIRPVVWADIYIGTIWGFQLNPGRHFRLFLSLIGVITSNPSWRRQTHLHLDDWSDHDGEPHIYWWTRAGLRFPHRNDVLLAKFPLHILRQSCVCRSVLEILLSWKLWIDS